MTPAARLGGTVSSAFILVAVNALPVVGVAFWGGRTDGSVDSTPGRGRRRQADR